MTHYSSKIGKGFLESLKSFTQCDFISINKPAQIYILIVVNRNDLYKDRKYGRNDLDMQPNFHQDTGHTTHPEIL